MIKALWTDEDGLTTVEYALLLALLVVAAIGTWATLGSRISASVTATDAAFGTAGFGT